MKIVEKVKEKVEKVESEIGLNYIVIVIVIAKASENVHSIQ
jgi:hypothetical protein